jgi:hypothetical protein
MDLEHGTLLVYEHLVRVGDDGGCDAQRCLHEANAFVNSSRPCVIVESEL